MMLQEIEKMIGALYLDKTKKREVDKTKKRKVDKLKKEKWIN